MRTNAPPILDINPTGLMANITGTMAFSAIPQGQSTKVPLFTTLTVGIFHSTPELMYSFPLVVNAPSIMASKSLSISFEMIFQISVCFQTVNATMTAAIQNERITTKITNLSWVADFYFTMNLTVARQYPWVAHVISQSAGECEPPFAVVSNLDDFSITFTFISPFIVFFLVFLTTVKSYGLSLDKWCMCNLLTCFHDCFALFQP